MVSNMVWGRAVLVFGLLGGAGWLVCAQNTPGSRIQIPQPEYGEGQNIDALSEAKRMRALNAERHRSMVSDTERLVKLVRQLDAEIASNPTDELTPEELQKLGIIEKLAHSVKTKMAQSFGGGPEFQLPTIDTRGSGRP